MHARPTSTMKPTWVKMLMSIRAMFTPTIEQSRHIGTTRITASGSDQLSYWAASTRKTSTTARMKANMAVLPVWSCKSASSVHCMRMAWGSSCSTSFSMASIAWPELTPGGRVQVDRGRGIHVVPDDHHRAADVADRGDAAQRHHPAPVVAHPAAAVRSSICLRKLASPWTLTCQVRPKQVEVVDVERAQVDLERVEQLGDRDARPAWPCRGRCPGTARACWPGSW